MSGTGVVEAADIVWMRRRRGSVVTLRRLVPNGSPIDVSVIATVQQYRPNELAGDMRQGDRWAKISNDEIAAAGWPGPPRTNDQLIIDAKVFTTRAADTVKMGSAVLSHTLIVRGGS